MGLGLRIAQLGEHVVDVCVGLDIEVHVHAHQTVVGVDRIHVVHVVHAAHLLLDGRGDRLLDGLRVGPDVIRLNKDFGRDDFGKLSDGQAGKRDQADDDRDDRDHHGHDGTVDEEFIHVL